MKVIRGLQLIFRLKLNSLRHAQLRAAAERKERQAKEWAAYLRKLKDWKEQCRPKCEACGGKYQCVCRERPTLMLLAALIRRRAGIWKGHAKPRDEWDGWGNGKDGPRGCGPSAWDNAIRASEEDREE